MIIQQLPESYQKNILIAVKILKEAGCTDIFLFGSLTRQKIRDNSDIDIAVQGCPKGKFFSVMGNLLMTLDYQVDLVNLDNNDPFSQYIKEKGELIKIE